MRKQEIPKLTKNQISGVKNWLKANDQWKEHHCPFISSGPQNRCLLICKLAFPRIKKVIYEDGWATTETCPCQNYTLSYVKRIARRMVED